MKPQSLLIYILVFCAVVFFAKTCGRDIEPVRIKTDYKKAVDSLKNINKWYSIATKLYQNENKSLTEKLSETEALLRREKVKVTYLQKNVRVLAQSNWDTLSTETKLSKCDSLKQAVIVYEAERDITDSLTDAKICSLTELIELEDQQIITCDSSYQALKQTLESSITDTKEYEKELEGLNKKIKRKKFFNCVLGAGAAIASIVASTLLLTGIK